MAMSRLCHGSGRPMGGVPACRGWPAPVAPPSAMRNDRGVFVLGVLPIVMGLVGIVLFALGLAKRSAAKSRDEDTTGWTWCTALGCTFMLPLLMLLGYGMYWLYLVVNKSGPLL